MPHAVIAQDA